MLNPLERLFYKELFGARMRPVGRMGPAGIPERGSR